MSQATTGAPAERPTLVVADGLAARQWELVLAEREIAAGTTAWQTPEIQPYAGWLETLWLESGEPRGAPLTPRQSRALWRRVIAESKEADDLIGVAGVADWAAAAWELLHRWRIDPGAERASAGQLDYRALLSWCRDYRERLDTSGWVDRAELERAQRRVGALGGQGRDHHDRHRPEPHQPFEEVDAVHVRHLDVEGDDVG